MKLSRIQVDNFLGAHQIDVKLTTPVTLFAGPNGAAKSSIGEAVRMAMTGDVVRVKLKKEYSQLVTDGAKAGGGLVTTDNESTYEFNVPGGEVKADDGLPTGDTVGVALNGQYFSSMTDDERRTFLFKLAGIKIKSEDVKARMIARACELAKIEATLPLLRTGFPDACAFAKTKATEAKGAWRTAAGKNWGSNQSEGWEAEQPAPLAPGVQPTAETLAAFDSDIAELNQKIGQITAETNTRTANANKRTTLATQAGNVDRVRENLEHAKGELAVYGPQVVALRERAAGSVRVGLVHDMAAFIVGLDYGDDGNPESDKLLDRYEQEHGEISEVGTVDQDAKNSLPEYERGLEVMKNAVRNLERDLAGAIAAKAEFDALAPAEKEEPLEDLGALKNDLAQLKTDRATTQEQVNAAANYDNLVTASKKKIADVAKHHADVLAWTVVADALAPDGIPGDLLVEALAPVNESLAVEGTMTAWKQVCISPDMQITAGGRSYNLLSESEKWRTDAMVAVTVARLSGLKILMLDRVDVLDLQGRATLLSWLNALVIDGDIETGLLFATLKALPAKMYPTMTAHWIEGGAIATFKAAA
jgi:hypothetical protein